MGNIGAKEYIQSNGVPLKTEDKPEDKQSKGVPLKTEDKPGMIVPNDEINWDCPCLGNMATGPCGLLFRDAFTCLKNSTVEPRGSECYEKFKVMQDCFDKHPGLYNSLDDDNMKDLEKDDSSKGVNAESKT